MSTRIGYCVVLIVIAALGFHLRGLLPAAAPPPFPHAAAMPPPVVGILTTELEDPAPLKEYIAQVQPVQSVKLSSQVSGTVAQVHFTEGSMVQKGDLLLTLDPAKFEARVAQAKAALARAQAAQERADKFLKMYQTADKRSISRSAMDDAEANAQEAKAAVMQAAADLSLAEIDLGYTRIRAPISGKIGQALITEGNYITPGNSILAEIVQMDPVRVVFSLPDAEYLRLLEMFGLDERNVGTARVVLPNGTRLKVPGTRDFESNVMDAGTGTIAVHLRFANQEQLLVPNAYVTVQFRHRSGMKKILLPQAAVMRDADGPFVWTLNEDDNAVQTRIVTGEMSGQRVVVDAGLAPGRKVVVSGLQKVRPGSPVTVLANNASTTTETGIADDTVAR